MCAGRLPELRAGLAGPEPRMTRGGVMGALAQTERVTTRGTAELGLGPERPRPRRRSSTGRQTSWNVLAEEIVPFCAPRLQQSAPGSWRDMAGRPGSTARSRPERPVRAAQQAAPSPSTARAGDQAAHVRSRRVVSRPRGLRRLLPGAGTLAVLVSVWLGAGAMAGLHRPALAIPAAAVKVHGGYLYVARPGDTLWSIASKLEPGGDPRVLVAQLAQQLHGSELVAGDELKLP